MVRDEEVCERLRGRWQRDQGRLTSGDISCERWDELCAEVDKVLACLGSATSAVQHPLRKHQRIGSVMLWLVNSGT